MQHRPKSEHEHVHLESFVSCDQLIKKTNSFKVEHEVCCLCSSDYKLKDYIAKLRTCDHVFHKKCIDEWICTLTGEELRCPSCNICM